MSKPNKNVNIQICCAQDTRWLRDIPIWCVDEMTGNICQRHLRQSLLSLASAETIYVRKWQPSIHSANGNVPFVQSAKEQQQCGNSDTIEFHPLSFRSRSIAFAAWPPEYHTCETRKNRFSSLSMAQYNSINSHVRRINMSCATHKHTHRIDSLGKNVVGKAGAGAMDTDVIHHMHMWGVTRWRG